MLTRLLGVTLLFATLTMTTSAQNKPATKFPQLLAVKTGLENATAPKADFTFVAKAKLPNGATVLSAAKAKSGAIWIVTDKGAYRSQGEAYIPLEEPRHFLPHQPPIGVDTVVRAVTSDKDGHVWAATTSGLYATDGNQWWQHFDRRDGMPYDDVRCVFLAANGDIWGGTE